MLRKFAWWFIIFGLSFLVQSWGWTNQGTAFLYLHLGCAGFFLAVVFLLCLVVGEGFGEKIGFSFIVAIVAAILMGVTLFATWGATQLFDVEFTVAYQIMTFGQCLCGSSKKDND